ncbi:hypothetical protein [Stenotrophomonas phage IME-SM1]|uniref:Uncharacterized protein n=1 Tax=Stenotrophomonas phage IME-SM1 TaxID=1654717 RepID=A0A0H4ITG1_9CAUD|nr:hypothetical protein KMC40_gp144 [Stenotrophomonas phage IME-SM1]AKO61614.1 hypothetical protein [Stenotrophomonas phage IME-SM1]
MMHLYITIEELSLLSSNLYALVKASEEVVPDDVSDFKIYLVEDSLWHAVQKELDEETVVGGP